MVVFTCNYCGESLKKNKVEKHYSFTACRNSSPSLTCVDCLKDFLGNDFVAHTSCVTEQEKYSAKGFVPKPPSTKGKRQQERWIEAINEVLNNDTSLNPNIRKILQRISSSSNVPQKKPKFLNYCNNIFRAPFKQSDFVRTWEVLENLKIVNKPVGKQEPDQSEVNLADRKRKRVDSSNSSPNDESFNNLSESKSENGDLSSTKLRKKHKNKRSEGQLEVDESIAEEADVTKHLKKSKKKNLITNGNHSVEDIDNNEVQLEDNQNLQDEEDIHKNDLNQVTLKTKLSKKEKKQKRKQEKYEKQLLEINEATSEKPFEVIENHIPEENKKIKKKTKDLSVTENVGDTGALNGDSRRSKKKKKYLESLSETLEEHEESTEVDVTKRNKFNWEEIIIEVLKAKGELPLKRLEKKVVSEYMNTCATVKSVEEALAKFHKKVMKIPQVKVRKEVAKLVS